VPLYPHWRTFFRHAPLLKRQLVANQPHVTLHQLPPLASLAESDFALWVDTMQGETFDVVIADFPTADGGTKGLFTPESARQLFRLVKPSGVAAVHLTSPYQHPSLYWCLVGQFANMRLHVAPYRLGPSLYRDFGYVIVSRKPLTRLSRSLNIPVKTQYLYQKQDFSMLQRFPKDMRPDGRSMLRGCVFPPVPAMR
jgi:spermidine synthase